MPLFSARSAGAVAVAGAMAMLAAAVPAQAADEAAMPYDAELEAAIAPGDPAVLPADEEALRAIDGKHRRLIRLAQRQCSIGIGVVEAGERNPCVISTVERGVANADDEMLAAFHAALPLSVRFDADRRPDAWRYGLAGDDPS